MGDYVSNGREHTVTYEEAQEMEMETREKELDTLKKTAIRAFGGLCVGGPCPHNEGAVVHLRHSLRGEPQGVEVRIRCSATPRAGLHNGTRTPYNPKIKKGKKNNRTHRDCQDFKRCKSSVSSDGQELEGQVLKHEGVTSSISP